MEQVLTPEQRERFRKLQTRRDGAQQMTSSAP
jgi:Spy/CpxP family protein refolding chaperone